MSRPSEKPVIALDIGGVCIDLHFDKPLEKIGLSALSQIPPEFHALCASLETGQCSTEAFFSAFSALLKNRFEPEELAGFWSLVIGGTLPGMTDAVARFAGRYRFVFFSNTSAYHMNSVLRNLEFAHLISGAVYSYKTGFLKPDPRMFEAFESEWGVPAYYFDDSAVNVAAASGRGWNAVLFESPDSLVRALENGEDDFCAELRTV